MVRCAYVFVVRTDRKLVIRDLNVGMSVTNDAEAVVAKLMSEGVLVPGMDLLYYDTEGNLDAIEFDAGGFTGFKVGPRGAR